MLYLVRELIIYLVLRPSELTLYVSYGKEIAVYFWYTWLEILEQIVIEHLHIVEDTVHGE